MMTVSSPSRSRPLPRDTAMRQIIIDTETTGLDPEAGHRIIEVRRWK